MRPKDNNLEIVLKSTKSLDFKRIVADIIDKITPIPARSILENCEVFTSNLRTNYIDVLMAKIYADSNRHEEDLEALFSQLKNNDALQIYIGRCIEISKQTNSNIATILLGIYSGQVFVNPELLKSHISVVMLEILSSLNDTDIKHFCTLYDYLIDHQESGVSSHQAYYGLNEMKHESFLKEQIQVDPNLVSYFTSVNKLSNLGLISKGAGMWGGIDNFAVTINAYSHALKDLILEYEELSKYQTSP
jgi:hypothetical protein